MYNSCMLQNKNSIPLLLLPILIIHRWQERSMQDIVLDFSQVPSLENERRIVEDCLM